ncbi:MAG TPA: phosphatidylcholine/phosphatidylserine synthase [Thermopetrobacter sp.]|nr:phosphatidylcholine/phosphatidylserine synthase [Thermopetrobacter sp.]
MTDPGRRSRRLRLRRIPVRALLPNIITLLAIVSGITAIRLGVEGRFQLAIGAIVLAMVLDGIDGRLARLLKSATRFGAELDSLADFVNFGVAPAVLIYLWSLAALKNLGWLAALALAIACVLRLARFNVALDESDAPVWRKRFFMGIPAPAGAMLALTPIFLGFLGLVEGRASAPVVLVWVVLVAAGMISKLPTYSGKTASRIDRDMFLPLLASLVFGAALLVTYPWHVMLALSVAYVISLPFSWRSWRRHARQQHAQTRA